MIKKCIICGSTDFKIKSERFCSQTCIHKYGSIKASKNKIKCPICDKEFPKGNYKRHLKTHEKKYYHYFCENCGKEVFENYGSGRFCSEKCARSFSTKAKRKEINEKVSKTLKGRKYVKYFCNSCGEEIINRKAKYCSYCSEFYKYQKLFKKLNINNNNIKIANKKL